MAGELLATKYGAYRASKFLSGIDGVRAPSRKILARAEADATAKKEAAKAAKLEAAEAAAKEVAASPGQARKAADARAAAASAPAAVAVPAKAETHISADSDDSDDIETIPGPRCAACFVRRVVLYACRIFWAFEVVAMYAAMHVYARGGSQCFTPCRVARLPL
jgi:hypothetical protein